MADISVSFDIYDAEAVRILQEEDPDLLPDYSVNAGKDLAYNKKQVTNAITSGIIKGESIPKIASNLQSTMKNLNQSSAISAARTAATSAHNAGKLSTMKELAAMGVEVQKEWVATLDDRTRESHRKLDGERRDLDERFSNGLMYPGASGSSKETWRCRCTMTSYIPDYDFADEPRLTYAEWEQYKKATGSELNRITADEYEAARKWSETNSDIVTGKHYSTATEYEEYKYNKTAQTIEIREYNENGFLVAMDINIADATIKYNYGGGYGYQRNKQSSMIRKYLKKFGIKLPGAKPLTECKNFDDLVKYLDRNYYVSVDDSVKTLDFKAVKAGIEGIDKVLKEFPKAASVFNGVSTTSNGLMSTTYSGVVSYNSLYYPDENFVINEINALKLAGDCPKNETIQTVAAHETGHMLEIALIKKKQRSNPSYDTVDSWNNCTEAQEVISEACNNARKSSEGINPITKAPYTNYELKSQVSNYALVNDSECMAECVDEYCGNGDNASILSREVWKVLKSKLG